MTSPHTPPLIAASVFLVVCLIGYACWYGTIEAKSDRSAQLAADIRLQQEEIARLATVDQTFTSDARSTEAIDSRLVSANDTAPLVAELQAAGSDLGTRVTAGSAVLNAGAGNRYPTISLPLRITGSFDDVIRTLGAVEYAPYDVTVQDVSISKDRTVSGSADDSWTAAASLSVGSLQRSSSTGTHPL